MEVLEIDLYHNSGCKQAIEEEELQNTNTKTPNSEH